MKTTKIIKQIAGLILIVTFFLPLSRCEMGKVVVRQKPTASASGDQNVVDSTKPAQPNVREASDKGYNIPYKMFGPGTLLSWLMLLSFFWPVPLLLSSHFAKRKAILAGMTIVEPLVCIGAGYMVWAISTLGKTLLAGYLALGAISIYFIVSCYDNYVLIKRKLKKGHQIRR